jgi:hypothetical protein
MFARHRTAPDRDLLAISDAFHDRLERVTVTRRTEPPRIDPRNLRRRLGGTASGGLRERLDRRLSPT